MFRLPIQEAKIYPAAEYCIYCGSPERLSDEHIFPYGLGGWWVLPKGSCHECSRITSAYEGAVQRTMFGPLRMMFEMPTRRPRERPAKLPLKVQFTRDGEWTYVDVDRDIYPFLVLLPILTLPDEIKGKTREGDRRAAAKNYWVRAASVQGGFDDRCHHLAAELGVHQIMPTATSDANSFFRVLAKIAHAYTVAELGSGAFTPFLLPMICDGRTDEAVQYVGGIKHTEAAAAVLHQAWIAPYPPDPGLVTVRVRLLACLATPTYVVAVGRRN
ncbi:MAG TPA: hypothetical protein VHM92_08355 [Allosphingosinicella sp.]|nr:hypothetical protein [Allosphingosinicella sp.]